MTDKEREEMKAMFEEYMEEHETETESLKKRTAEHLAQIMDVTALQKHAVHEIGEFLDYYGKEDVSGMIKEFAELCIVMCAIRQHLSEGMWTRVWDKAIEDYAENYSVK